MLMIIVKRFEFALSLGSVSESFKSVPVTLSGVSCSSLRRTLLLVVASASG